MTCRSISNTHLVHDIWQRNSQQYDRSSQNLQTAISYSATATQHQITNMKISCYALALIVPSASAFFAAPRVSQKVSTTVSKTSSEKANGGILVPTNLDCITHVLRSRFRLHHHCATAMRWRSSGCAQEWYICSLFTWLTDLMRRTINCFCSLILHQLTPPLFLFLLTLHSEPRILSRKPLPGKHRRRPPRSSRAQQRRTIGHSLTRWNPALRHRTLGRRIHLDHPRKHAQDLVLQEHRRRSRTCLSPYRGPSFRCRRRALAGSW